MNPLGREWELKLDLLHAIARSQEALARILESVADVTQSAVPSAAALRDHVRVLSDLQAALARAVTGTGWHPPRRGEPLPPWLAEQVFRADRSEALDAEVTAH